MFKNHGISTPKTLFEKHYPNTCSFLRKYVYDDLTKITSVWFDIDEDKKEIEVYYLKNKRVVYEWTPISEVFNQQYTLDGGREIFLNLYYSEHLLK